MKLLSEFMALPMKARWKTDKHKRKREHNDESHKNLEAKCALRNKKENKYDSFWR